MLVEELKGKYILGIEITLLLNKTPVQTTGNPSHEAQPGTASIYSLRKTKQKYFPEFIYINCSKLSEQTLHLFDYRLFPLKSQTLSDLLAAIFLVLEIVTST